jgi:branched-chain amino acid transport system permease protein
VGLWRRYLQVETPAWLAGPVQLPFAVALRSNGEAVMMTYPALRLAIFCGAVVSAS